MKSNRINQIEEYVLNKNTVTLDTLTDVFNVSKNTIRRDIQELIKRGNIKKYMEVLHQILNYYHHLMKIK